MNEIFSASRLSPKVHLRRLPNYNRWEVRYSLTDITSNWNEVWKWCWQTFGHPGTDTDTGIKSSWDYHGGWLYFYDEKLVMMYLLRWSS